MLSERSSMSPTVSDRVHGFAPIATPDARVLILGSLPSQQSLQKHEYYGNPQNAFWRVMGTLFDAGPDIPYRQRAATLKRHGIAVWDVLQSSVRPGSMDAAIDQESARPNDFRTFFDEHRMLELLCFNGKKAAELYERLVAPQRIGTINDIAFRIMPSTSPAYASMKFDEKVRLWSIIRRPTDDHRSS
jgi:TDG/mug DNA glycosylase family protein